MKYVILGSSRGLGYWLSRELVSHGDVCGISRNPWEPRFTEAKYRYNHFSFDLCDYDDDSLYLVFIKKLIGFVKSDDVTLVLNAAQFYLGRDRLNVDQFKGLMNVNFFSLIRICHDFESSGVNLKRLMVINSVSGLEGQKNQHEYVASKHALMGYLKSLIKSTESGSFDVMCVNPGGMRTEIWDGYEEVDTTCFLEPKHVAALCVQLLLFPGKVFIDEFKLLPISDVVI